MRNDRIKWMPVIISIAAILVALVISTIFATRDKNALSQGCECGGHYELFDISRVSYRKSFSEYYYYKCDKCGDIYRSSIFVNTGGQKNDSN